jgi:isopenicillin N synthase-like dioxygenase
MNGTLIGGGINNLIKLTDSKLNKHILIMLDIIKIEDIENINKITKTGFIYIKIPMDIMALHHEISKYTKDFFMMSTEKKMEYMIDNNYNGYYKYGRIDNNNIHQLNEILVYRPDYFINNDVLNEYYNKMELFARKITKRLLETTIDEVILRNMIEPGLNTISMIHYDGKESDMMGMKEHTDWGLITLLHTDTPGLQIRIGDKWHDIDPIDGYFILNIGDITNEITNGKYPSTKHRVIIKEEKYSVAFFFEPNKESMVSINGTIMTFGDYLKTKYSES